MGSIVKKLCVLTLLAASALGIAMEASAQTSVLTRAEVKQQLVSAEAQGLVPSGGVDYPPSAREITRNKEAFARQHEADGARFTDETGYGGTRDGRTSD